VRPFKRRNTVLALLALGAAAVFVLPASSASAGTATTPNACANSVTANFSQIGVTTSGDDGLTTVTPGGAITLTGLTQSAAIPGAIFVAGYNLGVLTTGVNNVPANVQTKIEATNTVQGTQTTNQVGGSPPDGTVFVTTTVTDPDGTPGTGDETATDASFSVTYNNVSWTAGANFEPIDYRQESTATAPPTAASNTLLINALVGGVFNVQFRCAPGTVTPPDPGTITLIDPAPSFDTTVIPQPQQPPIANAGPDQTVASGAPVQLDGSGSIDPAGQALTYMWTQTAGPAVTLSDPTSPTPTFTAPTGPATLTFELLVCNPEVCDPRRDSVTVNVNAPPLIDATGVVLLNGQVSSTKTSKSFVFKVSNIGVVPITVDPATDITSSVDVNGTPTGTVSPGSGTKTVSPGASTRVKLSWSYPAGSLATGDSVVFHACVALTEDIITTNDCDDATATAK
jgi:hypothetical protein